MLRRVLTRDGRSRAFINDQPVGVALLRRAAALLVEVQGQHEQIGLADAASHAGLLDAFGVARPLREAVASAWRGWREATAALAAAREAIAAAQRDEDWLRHAVDELAGLAPQPDEEERLAQERQRLQQGERHAEAIAAALAELAPRDRRSPAPAAALRAASRALQRLVTPAQPEATNPAAPALAALERAEEALAEAESFLTRLCARGGRRSATAGAGGGAAVRAARRGAQARGDGGGAAGTARHAVRAAGSAGDRCRRSRGAGAGVCGRRARAMCRRPPRWRRRGGRRRHGWTGRWRRSCRRCGWTRRGSMPTWLRCRKREWGPAGTDAVQFLIATNPGQDLGPLGRIASGGELSRLMLALKVVLSAGSPVPTLVFDEVDADIGGATAAAVGERLTRVAERVQVLVVTHSPQVAARGGAHLLVSKQAGRGRTATRVDPLEAPARREEIARMLAGETVTEAARAAADDLLGAAV